MDNFVKENIEIKYCRDICNGTKHLNISNPSIDKNFSILREFEDDGSDEGKFLGWTLYAGGQQIDLFELMNKCEELITKFIKKVFTK